MSKNDRTEKGKKKMKKLLSVLLCCSTCTAFTLAKSKQILRFMKEKYNTFALGKKNEA